MTLRREQRIAYRRVSREGVLWLAAEHEHWSHRTWETTTYRWLAGLLPGADFIDVGAWIGPFTLFGAQLADRVLAIEPDPAAREQLYRSLALFNGAVDVSVSSCALGRARGRGTLHALTGGWGASTATMVRVTGGATEEVVVQTLDTAARAFSLRAGPALVIKIDTEGSEPDILHGAMEWLRGARPTIILAPHQRLYGSQDLFPALAALREIYPHVVTDRGEPLLWPESGQPEPSLIYFGEEPPP